METTSPRRLRSKGAAPRKSINLEQEFQKDENPSWEKLDRLSAVDGRYVDRKPSIIQIIMGMPSYRTTMALEKWFSKQRKRKREEGGTEQPIPPAKKRKRNRRLNKR